MKPNFEEILDRHLKSTGAIYLVNKDGIMYLTIIKAMEEVWNMAINQAAENVDRADFAESILKLKV